MLEYIFFTIQTYTSFLKAVTSSGITPVLVCEDEYFIVKLDEDAKEETLKTLEDYYDELMEMERLLAEKSQSDSTEDINAAGITIQLKDGRNVYASVSPELLNKVLYSITTDELNTLVCAITEAVEDPDERGLCQR
jgi:hypothetical protein